MADKADSLLKSYRDKRDFDKTPEPAGGKTGGAGEGLAFVVQKHDATRLHYDFRVEWDGVLKSWAVTRGPSLDPADKRLAVRTEDHPLDYGDFEGRIPKGAYGGGTVMLWDQGTWEPQGDPEAELAAGNLKMILHGQRMTGKWALIRMKPRGKETRENWLLIKEKDNVADPDGDLLAAETSIKTGRTMAEIAMGDAVWTGSDAEPKSSVKPTADPSKPKSTPAKGRRAGRSGAPPAFQPLQLATLVSAAPDGSDWLHELKYDGYRVEIALGAGTARFWTRSGLDWSDRFAPLLADAQALPCDSALIDGEVVVFDDDGRSDFSLLRQRLTDGGALSCVCFDILALDGGDLTGLPLVERKAILAKLFDGHDGPALRYGDHVRGSGPAMIDQVRTAGLEGVVSKRADAPYRGGRNGSWVKTKITRRQEFVIGGYSPSTVKGRAFSSILVGARDGATLSYRGRVGSGFDDDQLDALKARFAELATDTSPFATLPAAIARRARFVEATLVAEIDFAELTADGQIRHGVFKGLREDKPAREIVDETPVAIVDRTAPKTRAAAAAATPAPRRTSRAGPGGKTEVAGIALTHPDRVVFEDEGLTKRELARYIEAVAPRMLVHLGDRPLTLVRCPGGRKRGCFFQKHASDGFPDAIKALPIKEKDGTKADYMVVADVAGLVGCVQMNGLEFHIWGSRRGKLEKPDRLVFDLDPDESVGFDAVKAAAVDLRDVLATIGLRTFPLVTGGKGIHVVAPLTGRNGWGDVKDFARNVAALLAAHEPDRFVATMAKAKRKGRIFIDWLRNERGATAIAPYSTRAREGVPVACPVGWDELAGLMAANGFGTAEVLDRLADPDPWQDYGDVRQSLSARMLRSVAADDGPSSEAESGGSSRKR